MSSNMMRDPVLGHAGVTRAGFFWRNKGSQKMTLPKERKMEKNKIMEDQRQRSRNPYNHSFTSC